MYQWNRIESLNVDSYKYSQQIFKKGAKPIQCRNTKIVFSKNGTGTTRHPHAQK